jgi:flagellar hook-associated protein 3 FlgL
MTMISGTARITPGIVDDQMTSTLDADQLAIAQLQEKISSGQAITKPSDDPVGVVQSLSTQAALTRGQQYQSNAQDGMGWLGTANTALSSAVTQLYNIRNLVLGAGSNSSQPQTYADLAQQVGGIRQELLALANTTYLNRPVFAGTSATPQAYDSAGNYLGSGASPTRTVAPGTSLPVSVTNPFGSGSSNSVFAAVDQVISDLQTGTPASIANLTGTDLGALDTALNSLSSAAGQVGESYQQMQYLSDQAVAAQQTLSSRLAGLQDVDLAKAVTDLQMQQNSYQAALWATSKVVEPSLAQFLS